jgi:hypothetical protein
VLNRLRHRCLSKKIAKVVGKREKLKPNLIIGKVVAG